MNKVLLHFISLLLILITQNSIAQIDSGLESGRYTSDRSPTAQKDTKDKEPETKIKFRTKSKKDKKNESAKVEEFTPLVPPSEKKEEVILINPAPVVIPINAPGEVSADISKTESAQKQTAPTPQSTGSNNLVNDPSSTNTSSKQDDKSAQSTIGAGFDSFKNYIWGDQEITIQAYEEQIHPEDTRLNSLEIDVLPSLYQVTSKSGYSPRDFKTNSVAIYFSPKFSLTPNFQVQVAYLGSFSGSIPSNVDGVESSVAKFENTEIGFRFKKFYGLSRKASSLTYGIDYIETKITTAADDSIRGRTKSSGLNLAADFRSPLTPNYALTSGFEFAPKLSHSESSTDFILDSGSGNDASRFGAKVGGEYKFSRRDQFVWSLRYQLEKNVFSGTAETTDPNSGLKPENVSVEQTFITFSFGYRWGE